MVVVVVVVCHQRRRLEIDWNALADLQPIMKFELVFPASEAHEHGFCVTDSEGQRPHHNLPSRLSRSQLRKKKVAAL